MDRPVGGFIGAERVLQRLRAAQILRQPVGKLVDRERRVDAQMLDRAFDAEALAVPNLLGAIQLAQEEHAAVFGMLGREHEDCVGFVESGEIKEIGVLAKRKIGIGVSRQDARRRNHGRGAAKGFEEFGAPLAIDLHRYRSIAVTASIEAAVLPASVWMRPASPVAIAPLSAGNASA